MGKFYGINFIHDEKYLQKTNDKIAISFIKIFKLGPLVSFNGSPTVSPMTAALCIYEPFLTTTPSSVINPASIYFFALSHAPPVLDAERAIWTPLTMAPGRKPIRAFGPKKNPIRNGVTVT